MTGTAIVKHQWSAPVLVHPVVRRWLVAEYCGRDFCKAIWKGFCPPKRKRLELRYLSYSEADKLIRETNGAWTISKEEDSNRCIGWVYLELLEECPRFDKQPNAKVSGPSDGSDPVPG